MWIAELEASPNTTEKGRYRLPAGEHSIGRLDCAITCQHGSISRTHAILKVALLSDGTSPLPGLTVEDFSRYGTIVNGTKLVKGENKVLDDLPPPIRIRCGFQHSFSLHHENISLCFLRSASAGQKEACKQLGFRIKEGWNPDCSHIVVSKRTPLTPTLALSLARQKQLVTSEWLDAWEDRKGLRDPAPEEAEYLPLLTAALEGIKQKVLDEAQIQNLKDMGSEKVLQGRHFDLSCLTEESNVWEAIITAAGGECGQMHKRRYTTSIVTLVSNEKSKPEEGSAYSTPNRLLKAFVNGSLDGAIVDVPKPEEPKQTNQPSSGPTRKKAKKGVDLLALMIMDSDDDGSTGGNEIIEDSDAAQRSESEQQDKDEDATDAEDEAGHLRQSLEHISISENAPKKTHSGHIKPSQLDPENAPPVEISGGDSARADDEHQGIAARSILPKDSKRVLKTSKQSGKAGWSVKGNHGALDAPEGGSCVITLPLIVKRKATSGSTPARAHTGKNFKAFRRKRESRPSSGRILSCVTVSGSSKDTGTSAFLNAEKERRVREQAAEELFAVQPAFAAVKKRRVQ